MPKTERTLEEQRLEFTQSRFLAMPLSGAFVWTVIALASIFLTPFQTVWVLFIGNGSTVYIAMLVSRYTGENFLDKTKPANVFDHLFMHTIASSAVIYAIAIPFFLVDYTSLPLTVGILTSTMWIPFSWIIQHPVGLIHCLSRVALIVSAWYLFPEQRFLVIPLIIVFIYVITICVLELRWRKLATREQIATSDGSSLNES